MSFVGFLVMENRVKDVTSKIIGDLNAAQIRTVMVTGDNALTAISVGRQCGIVKPKQRVFLGDVLTSHDNEEGTITWKDYDFSDNRLDPETCLLYTSDAADVYSV
eukprot:TRINITY_DN15550_c0_g1_i1.p1 TRINITY_DN15550_c0_g1~~TRINITY_DN15550_c0_g1_i1.p1  ORF type:complete len:105 (-),score=13.90 TRINITY_DN15550_c0_g1_i1:33-347(-)